MDKKSEFVGKEQDWQNETTRYWFDFDGSSWCVAESGGQTDILDFDGKPLLEGKTKERVRAACIVTDEMRAA